MRYSEELLEEISGEVDSYMKAHMDWLPSVKAYEIWVSHDDTFTLSHNTYAWGGADVDKLKTAALACFAREALRNPNGVLYIRMAPQIRMACPHCNQELFFCSGIEDPVYSWHQRYSICPPGYPHQDQEGKKLIPTEATTWPAIKGAPPFPDPFTDEIGVDDPEPSIKPEGGAITCEVA